MAKETTDAAAARHEKLKILQSTMDKIEKSYGKGAIMKLGDRPDESLELIPTGIPLPSSSTVTELSEFNVTFIVLQ